MNAKEQGFLLLTSSLGDPARKVLTTAQFRTLAQRVRASQRPAQLRELEPRDLIALGYGAELAQRICRLLSDEQLLHHYIRKGRGRGCIPVSRISEDYPMAVHNRLGDDAPGCVWLRGDPALLRLPAVSVVGSRDIRQENERFAREVGRQAALQGFVLVSGNARGADHAAQQAALEHGGKVIAIVADELERHRPDPNILYMSEEGFGLPFSSQRALSRNRLIHCMGLRTFVAQCAGGHGGTWDGTTKNLRHRWSPVYCFRDGSAAQEQLIGMGAEGIGIKELEDIPALPISFYGLFDG